MDGVALSLFSFIPRLFLLIVTAVAFVLGIIWKIIKYPLNWFLIKFGFIAPVSVIIVMLVMIYNKLPGYTFFDKPVVSWIPLLSSLIIPIVCIVRRIIELISWIMYRGGIKESSDVLGVASNDPVQSPVKNDSIFFKNLSSEEEIKEQYNKLMQIYSPFQNEHGDTKTALLIQDEYDQIMDLIQINKICAKIEGGRTNEK